MVSGCGFVIVTIITIVTHIVTGRFPRTRGGGVTMMTIDHPPHAAGNAGEVITMEECMAALSRLILREVEAQRRTQRRRRGEPGRRPALRPPSVPTVEPTDLDKEKARQALAQMGLRRSR